MQSFESLNAGGFYHVYSHGVGGRDLFVEPEDYDYFLKLYGKYISPVADTHAWVWLKNYFHVLVRVRENNIVFSSITPDRVLNPVGGNTNDKEKK